MPARYQHRVSLLSRRGPLSRTYAHTPRGYRGRTVLKRSENTKIVTFRAGRVRAFPLYGRRARVSPRATANAMPTWRSTTANTGCCRTSETRSYRRTTQVNTRHETYPSPIRRGRRRRRCTVIGDTATFIAPPFVASLHVQSVATCKYFTSASYRRPLDRRRVGWWWRW